MKIAINGFGRIGRLFFREASKKQFADWRIEIVAINDLASRENLRYLLEHDSVYGKFKISDEDFQKIKFFQEKEPQKLPWGELGIDVVVESTGFFTSYEKAKAHLEGGAKRVVITAPVKDRDDAPAKERVLTFTPNLCPVGVENFKITSNASCTTNAVAPIVSILSKTVGIKKAVLNTVHAYTATQGIVDRPDEKDWTRGRGGAMNLSPSSTGAALAAAKVVPAIEGKFDGVAVRVPVPAGSLIDLTFVAGRSTTVEEINKILLDASQQPEWQGILKVTDVPLVSTDILGEEFATIVEPTFTRVIDGDLVKIFSWYDNEWGYCSTLVKHIERLRECL